MPFGKIMRTSVPLAVALTLAAAPANATSCPSHKAVYAFEFDGARIVYTGGKSTTGGGPKRVRFETRRDGKPAWSVEGEIFCDDIAALCILRLDRPAGAKESSDIDNEDKPGCSKFPLTVTEIHEGAGKDFTAGNIAYIAFGGLTQFTLSCRHLVDLRILDKKRLSDVERDEGFFVLPSYVRFSSCGR